MKAHFNILQFKVGFPSSTLAVMLIVVAQFANADSMQCVRKPDAARIIGLLKPGEIILVTDDSVDRLSARKLMSGEITPSPCNDINNEESKQGFSITVQAAQFFSSSYHLATGTPPSQVPDDGTCWKPTQMSCSGYYPNGELVEAAICKDVVELNLMYVFRNGRWKNLVSFVEDWEFARASGAERNSFRLHRDTMQKIEQCHQEYKAVFDR